MHEILSHLPQGETLIHAGFALVGTSYLVHNPLALRMLAIAAYAVFAVAVVRIQSPAMETLLSWYAVFMLIAGARIVWILHERRPNLGPEERRLHQMAFPALDIPVARRLMRRGCWRTLQPGEVLTVEGELAAEVFVVMEGRVRVEVGGCAVAEVGPGQFVGEIGLITDRPATATATAAPDPQGRPLRVLAWPREELAGRMRRCAATRSAVHAAIGPDLARKLAGNTLALTRPLRIEARGPGVAVPAFEG
jgi:CRP-like cAMP-binding protein